MSEQLGDPPNALTNPPARRPLAMYPASGV